MYKKNEKSIIAKNNVERVFVKKASTVMFKMN